MRGTVTGIMGGETRRGSAAPGGPPTEADVLEAIMKRILVPSALMTVGLWFPTTAVDQSQPQQTQAPRVVRMRTLRPGDVLYVLLGGGGNTLALMREDGVVVIDTKLPGWGWPIRDASQ